MQKIIVLFLMACTMQSIQSCDNPMPNEMPNVLIVRTPPSTVNPDTIEQMNKAARDVMKTLNDFKEINPEMAEEIKFILKQQKTLSPLSPEFLRLGLRLAIILESLKKNQAKPAPAPTAAASASSKRELTEKGRQLLADAKRRQKRIQAGHKEGKATPYTKRILELTNQLIKLLETGAAGEKILEVVRQLKETPQEPAAEVAEIRPCGTFTGIELEALERRNEKPEYKKSLILMNSTSQTVRLQITTPEEETEERSLDGFETLYLNNAIQSIIFNKEKWTIEKKPNHYPFIRITEKGLQIDTLPEGTILIKPAAATALVPTPAPQPATAQSCAQCGQEKSEGTKLQMCGRCRQARYCSIVCQHQDWDNHKLSCTAVKK